MRVALASFVLLVALYLIVDPERGRWLTFIGAPVFLLAFTVAASWRAASATRRVPEKRFWRLLAGAFTLWLAAVLFASPLAPTVWNHLLGDIAFAGFYTLLIVAVEARPHRRFEAATGRLENRLMAPAVGIFVGGWLAYFSIVAVIVNSDRSESNFQSLLLFSLLDIYVTGRLWIRAGRTTGGWRRIYLLLGCGGFGFFVSDFFPVILVLRDFAWDWGTLADAMWSLPLLFFVAAARLAAHGPSSAGAPGAAGKPTSPIVRPLPTILWTLSFPVLHALLETTGWLTPAGHAAREVIVILMVAILGAYALLQRHLLVRHSLDLWRARRETEDELKESEQDLLLMVARDHQQAKLERHEQTYKKAFQASPDGLALSSWSDGKLLDANASFADFLGRSRDEILGRSAGELGLWKNAESRRRTLDRVTREGSVRYPVIELVAADGQVARFDISYEKIVTGEMPVLLSVLRRLDLETGLDGPREGLEESTTGEAETAGDRHLLAVALESAALGLVAADSHGAVILVNESAERLLGSGIVERLESGTKVTLEELDLPADRQELVGPDGVLDLLAKSSPRPGNQP